MLHLCWLQSGAEPGVGGQQSRDPGPLSQAPNQPAESVWQRVKTAQHRAGGRRDGGTRDAPLLDLLLWVKLVLQSDTQTQGTDGRVVFSRQPGSFQTNCERSSALVHKLLQPCGRWSGGTSSGTLVLVRPRSQPLPAERLEESGSGSDWCWFGFVNPLRGFPAS